MPPVQLSRLRPQVNTLMAQYQDEDLFRKTLFLIFEKYAEKKSAVNVWLRPDPGMPAYNLSPIVLNELENAFETLAKVHPEQAIRLADMLWEQDMYEPRKLAITALSALLPPHHEVFIEYTRRWIPQGVPDSLVGEIMEHSSRKPEIVTSPQWSALVRAWIWSEDKSLQKIGMRAAGNMARSKGFHNLPLVFELIDPLYTQHRIALQKNLADLTRVLIARSEPETAAFLISLVEMQQKKEVSALVRKLLPLFDEFYQKEIRKVVI
jgi:hypothetical protein